MAKRETADEKYERMINKAIQLDYLEVEMSIEQFYHTFQVLRETDKSSRVSKKGVLLLQTTGEYVEYESKLEKTILEVLDKAEDVVAIRTQCLALGYSYRGTYTYFPDIVYLTKAGRCCVIEVKDLVSMFKRKTLAKYHVLEDFCKLNGLGYAMLNDKQDFSSLISSPINPYVRDYLNYLFTFKTCISWASIKDECKARGYTVEDVLKICYYYGWQVKSAKSRVWAFSIKK